MTQKRLPTKRVRRRRILRRNIIARPIVEDRHIAAAVREYNTARAAFIETGWVNPNHEAVAWAHAIATEKAWDEQNAED